MGIKGLSNFLEKNTSNAIREINVKELQDKIIAIDTSIILYQFMIAIKSDNQDFITSTGKNTTHIHAILIKTFSLLKRKIKPIFVFDGCAPAIKKIVLDNRKKIKNKAFEMISNINDELKNNKNQEEINILELEKTKYLKRTVLITKEQIKECQEIIQLLGIPIIESPEEADAQCAWLIKNELVDYVASEDMDLLTFGTTKLLRGLNSKNKIIEYNLEKILEDLEITYKQFIELCILLGCDYCSTLNKIGPIKAFENIKKYKTIKKILKKNNIKVENFDYEIAKIYFKNPPVNKIMKSDLIWNIPDYEKLKILLVEKYEYNQEKLDQLFGTLKGGYYSVICGEKTKEEYYSEKRSYYNSIISNISFD